MSVTFDFSNVAAPSENAYRSQDTGRVSTVYTYYRTNSYLVSTYVSCFNYPILPCVTHYNRSTTFHTSTSVRHRTVTNTNYNGDARMTFHSDIAGHGLAGDAMQFTLSTSSEFYNYTFDNSGDAVLFNAGKIINVDVQATYEIQFTDGLGVNGLIDPSMSFSGGGASWITANGYQQATHNVVFDGTVTGVRFVVTPHYGGNEINSLSGTLTCFARGTDIATPNGVVAVQSLRIGDPVLTADGETRLIKWIGRQTVDTKFGIPDRLCPVRVRAGALGDGLPLRDLVVTADHALLLDGYLVNASALVNGDTIHFDTIANIDRKFTVFHIEAEDHAIILAEGVPAETYLDADSRRVFDNYDEYVALYGQEDGNIKEMPNLRISSARLLPAALSDRLSRKVAA